MKRTPIRVEPISGYLEAYRKSTRKGSIHPVVVAGEMVFIFLLAKGLRGQAFTKEASLYLVVSSGLLAVVLTASPAFSWLDAAVSTAATVPVVLGMSAGQQLRDKIAPETFRTLVLIAVIAAGAELARHGLFG